MWVAARQKKNSQRSPHSVSSAAEHVWERQVFGVFVSVAADVHVGFVVCVFRAFFFFFIVHVSDNKSQVLPSLVPTGVKDEKLLPDMNS